MLKQIDTVLDILAQNASLRGNQPAVITQRETLTFAELERNVHAFAHGLNNLGVQRGTAVGLLCTNRTEWIVSTLGTILAGGRVAAFNTWSKRWDLDHLLRSSHCEILIALADSEKISQLPLLEELVPEAWSTSSPNWRSAAYPDLRDLILIGGESQPAGTRRFDDVLATPGVSWTSSTSQRDDVALVLFTSGSTAEPKAVPLIQGDALEHGRDVGDRMGIKGGDRIWLAVPLFWSYGGANALMVALTHGCTIVLQETFAATEALAIIEEQNCNVAYTLPNITAMLLAHPEFSTERVSSLIKGMTIGSKADVIAAGTGLQIEAICNAYGSTEIYGCCTATPHDWPLERKSECQGPPLPRISISVRDPLTSSPLPVGEVGEICVSGQVMKGYFGQSKENSSSFNELGEYRTGDLGHVDEEGNLHFAARASEMIKSGGINIAPAEVEQFLRTHPGVKEAAVVGIEDPEKGQVAVAFVIADTAVSIDEGQLRDYCKEHIASYKIPVRIIVSAQPFPTTSTGKLSRRELGELAHNYWPR